MRFFIHYPRGFANEYTIYVADESAAAERLAGKEGFEEINRKEATRLALKREGSNQNFGHLIGEPRGGANPQEFGPWYRKSADERFEMAAAATDEWLEESAI